MCPFRWSTGTSGRCRDQAIAFAAAMPTSSAPISPGPCVTAMRSTSSSVAPACSERLAHDGSDQLEVPARRHLRHDAAEPRVQIRLRRNDVRANLPAVGDERHRRLVATGLDPEDHCLLATSPGIKHRESALSPKHGDEREPVCAPDMPWYQIPRRSARKLVRVPSGRSPTGQSESRATGSFHMIRASSRLSV